MFEVSSPPERSVVANAAAARRAQRSGPALCLAIVLALASCAAPSSSPLPTDGRDVHPSANTSLPPAASPSAAGGASQSASARPSPAPSAEPAWQADWAEEPFVGTVQGVAVHNELLVAVGRDAAGLAAWVSIDGSSWQRHPVPDPPIDTGIPDSWGMGPIVRLGETLFSFGDLRGAGDFRRPVGWRSTNGSAWEFIESGSEFYQYGGLQDVVANDISLVAVTDSGLIAPYGTAWRWTAATSWTRTDLASTTDRPLWIDDLAWSGGTYVAIGAQYDPQDSQRWQETFVPAVWRSLDGQSWTPLAPPPGIDEWCALASMVDGFLLSGVSADGTRIWSSPNGSDWSAIPPVGEVTGATCWHDLTMVPGGWIAQRNTDDALVLSVSRDAAGWTESMFPGLSVGPVAALGDRALVFAHQGSEEGTTVLLSRME